MKLFGMKGVVFCCFCGVASVFSVFFSVLVSCLCVCWLKKWIFSWKYSFFSGFFHVFIICHSSALFWHGAWFLMFFYFYGFILVFFVFLNFFGIEMIIISTQNLAKLFIITIKLPIISFPCSNSWILATILKEFGQIPSASFENIFFFQHFFTFIFLYFAK